MKSSLSGTGTEATWGMYGTQMIELRPKHSLARVPMRRTTRLRKSDCKLRSMGTNSGTQCIRRRKTCSPDPLHDLSRRLLPPRGLHAAWSATKWGEFLLRSPQPARQRTMVPSADVLQRVILCHAPSAAPFFKELRLKRTECGPARCQASGGTKRTQHLPSDESLDDPKASEKKHTCRAPTLNTNG